MFADDSASGSRFANVYRMFPSWIAVKLNDSTLKTLYFVLYIFFFFREWGIAQKIGDLKISWYVPGEEEVTMVQKLLNKYLVPELNKIEQYVNGGKELTRQQLQQSLKIVTSLLSCQPLLPIWDEPAFQL